MSRPARDVTCISKISQDGGWSMYNDFYKVHSSFLGNPKTISVLSQFIAIFLNDHCAREM